MSITFFTADRKHEINFESFKGRVCLIFNSATGCGFAPQFAIIQEIYDVYHHQGFEVLDFPSNTFKQSLESALDAASICQLKYNTSYTTYEKVEVNGPNTHPLFVFLKEHGQATGVYGLKTKLLKDIEWNFTKFLVNKDQSKVIRFGPQTSPKEMISAIESFLNEM